jgi:hypothetical protein
MRQEKENITLTEAIKKYIDLKLEYLQLAFAERVSLLIGSIIFITFIALLGLAILLLFILLINNILITLIDIPWLVTLIEIAFVGLIIAVLTVYRKKLVVEPIANMIIQLLLDPSGKIKLKDDDDENDKE